MSHYTIKIPDIGEGITEVEIVEWFVQVGDRLIEDQPVAVVMTEKVSVEISSPVAGQVGSLGGTEGEVLAVGATLLDIALGDGVAITPEPAAASDPVVANEPLAQAESATLNTPPVVDLPSDPLPTTTQTTPHERLLQRVQASPAVRKRAANLGIDLNQLAQQLKKDHLHHADLDQYLASSQLVCSESNQAGLETVTVIPVRGVRRQIAKKMQLSKQTIPHFSYIEAVDMTALELWRQQLNQQWASSRGHLTLLPFLVRAMCLAIKDHPEVNARYDADQELIEQYTDVHVAIAVQTDEGLKVPVLAQAQQLSLWEMAAQIRQLAQDAQAGKGAINRKSTISLTSLGPLGGIAATPIINAPEVSIVGVNKLVPTPVVVEGQIQIRTMMNLSSSFDHRIVDGLHAAQFIQSVRTFLETPQVYLVD